MARQKIPSRNASRGSKEEESVRVVIDALQERFKMALALTVSLDNDTLFSVLASVDKMLARKLPDFHNNAMLDWRKTITAELSVRGIYTA
jgi:hypothetical protein